MTDFNKDKVLSAEEMNAELLCEFCAAVDFFKIGFRMPTIRSKSPEGKSAKSANFWNALMFASFVSK